MTLQDMVLSGVGALASGAALAVVKYVRDMIKHITTMQDDVKQMKENIKTIAQIAQKRMDDLEYYVGILLKEADYKETPYAKTIPTDDLRITL